MSRFVLPLVPWLLAPSLLAAQWEEGHVHELLDVVQGSAGDLFGWSNVPLGDVDGDGVTDFVASSPFDDRGGASSAGTLQAISGATGTVLWSRGESLTSSILGFSLEVLDWNGDGVLDAASGAPFSSTGGRVWVHSGVDGAVLATLDPSAAGDGFGSSLATGGDFDGDGLDDLAVGAPFVDTAAGSDVGRVYVYARGTGALLTSFDGPHADAQFGLGLDFLGDVSQPADGLDELVVGHRLASDVLAGEARVLSFAGGVVSELYHVGGVGMGPDIIGDRIDAGGDLDGDAWPDFFVGDLSADVADVFSGASGAAVPGGLVLPPDPALIGLEYMAQGACGGGGLRLSNALVQRVGG